MAEWKVERAKIREALKQGHTIADLIEEIIGCAMYVPYAEGKRTCPARWQERVILGI